MCACVQNGMMAEATPHKSLESQANWKSLNLKVESVHTLKQEAVSAQHDHLITEIETSEGPLATTLR